jgi:hypothetical protein
MKTSKDKTHHINDNGEPAYDSRFDWVSDFFNEVARAKIGKNWFNINKKGEIVKINNKKDLTRPFNLF